MSGGGDDGRAWEPLRPSFDDPVSWSVPLGRVGGTAIRLHAVFLAWAAVELARAIARIGDADYGNLDYDRMVLELGAFFLAALLHEAGRAMFLTRAGGVQDRIVLWPLGGIDAGRPGGAPRVALEAAAGGLAATAMLFCLLAPVLGVLTGTWWTVAIPTPLDYPALGAVAIDGRQPWWLLALSTLHDANFLLLLFHLLPLPMFAGGRLVHALLWRRFGWSEGTEAAVRIGVGGAVFVGFAGAVIGRWEIVGVACLGGMMAYRLFERASFVESLRPAGPGGLEVEDPPPPRRRRGSSAYALGPEEEAELREELAAAIDELTEAGAFEPATDDDADGAEPRDRRGATGSGDDPPATAPEASPPREVPPADRPRGPVGGPAAGWPVRPRLEDSSPGVDDPPAEGDLDRILEKISREGLAALTSEEREQLARATDRHRRGGERRA